LIRSKIGLGVEDVGARICAQRIGKKKGLAAAWKEVGDGVSIVSLLGVFAEADQRTWCLEPIVDSSVATLMSKMAVEDTEVLRATWRKGSPRLPMSECRDYDGIMMAACLL